jgi:hypothetical protein
MPAVSRLLAGWRRNTLFRLPFPLVCNDAMSAKVDHKFYRANARTRFAETTYWEAWIEHHTPSSNTSNAGACLDSRDDDDVPRVSFSLARRLAVS